MGVAAVARDPLQLGAHIRGGLITGFPVLLEQSTDDAIEVE
jgi:hypothetical protein